MRRIKQTELFFPDPPTWGGHRKGAGRRRRGDGVAHAPREHVSRHDPLLVTMKLARGLPSLRTCRTKRLIEDAIAAAQRAHFRIVHFSIQGNHLHLIVEADDGESLASAMKGLSRRIASKVNALWKRKGRVFAQRFHDRALRSLRAVRNALRYVLNNDLKHGCRPLADRSRPDPYSSGRWFDGWLDWKPDLESCSRGAPVVAGGWKLSIGWKRFYRLLAVSERPRSGGPRCAS